MSAGVDLVSVLMSVYKTDVELLDRAVKSILNQTYNELEFIIIDDGADRDCLYYLERIKDPRVLLIHNSSNVGLAASLNRGIDIAKGKYIARMDADDYSFPDRIYEQVRYMNQHIDVDVLACISMDVKEGKLTGGIGGAYVHFNNEDMQIELSLAPKTFPHPTVMFRASFLNDNNIRYDETFMRSQDYDMWARCSVCGKLDSLQRVLLLYNTDDEKNLGLSEKQVYYSNQTKIKCMKRLLPDASDKEKNLYIHMRDKKMTGSVKENLAFIGKLIESNKTAGIYNRFKFRTIIYFWWGRKALYYENRDTLCEFFKHPDFIINALISVVCRFPMHLCQQIYTQMIVKKAVRRSYDVIR